MSAVRAVQPALFPGYGGAQQERERRLASRDAYLAAQRRKRDAVIAECAKLNRSLTWYQGRGFFERAAEVQELIDRKLAALKDQA